MSHTLGYVLRPWMGFFTVIALAAASVAAAESVIEGHVAADLRDRLLLLRHVAFRVSDRFPLMECRKDKFIRLENFPYGAITVM
jgi:hypothetical protein